MKKLSDKLDVQTILNLISAPGTHAIVSGYRVKVSGVRLSTFAQKGADCICCDRKGEFFRVEDNSSGPHLNLYAYGTDGREKLMTRDHIIPKSHKGPESVANMSPMCARCNSLRGVLDQAEFIADWKAGRYERDGDITLSRLAEKLDRRSEKKASLHPRYKANLERYVKRFGKDGHLSGALAGNGIGKRWKQEELLEICRANKDDDGAAIMDKMLRTRDAWRKRMVKYCLQNGLINETNSIVCKDQALGVLMTMSRQHLDNPTEQSAAKLRKHLAICKELR